MYIVCKCAYMCSVRALFIHNVSISIPYSLFQLRVWIHWILKREKYISFVKEQRRRRRHLNIMCSMICEIISNVGIRETEKETVEDCFRWIAIYTELTHRNGKFSRIRRWNRRKRREKKTFNQLLFLLTMIFVQFFGSSFMVCAYVDVSDGVAELRFCFHIKLDFLRKTESNFYTIY